MAKSIPDSKKSLHPDKGELIREAVMGPNRDERINIPGLSIKGTPEQVWERKLASKLPDRFKFIP